MSNSVLRATSLSKQYGKTRALDAVDLEVRRGELLAITGPSGSGKSTLLLCLTGILRPDSGTVEFAGRSLSERSERELSLLRRTRFGILFQFGQLIPEMTLAENVALPLLMDGRRRCMALRAAREALDRFGIADLASARPTSVSGGQAQRAALARALVTEPHVLFADEPTGALDTAAGRLVMDELVASAHDRDTAVVLVTHDPNVAATADSIVCLRDGAIVTEHVDFTSEFR